MLLTFGFCGCSLKGATKFIAWLQLVIVVIVLLLIFLFTCVGAAVISEVTDEKAQEFVKNQNEQNDEEAFANHLGSMFLVGAGAVVGVVLAAASLVLILQLVATIYLLVGANKGRPGYLIFWIVLSVIHLLGAAATMSTAGWIYFGINFYFTWIVFSFYHQLKEDPEPFFPAEDGTKYHRHHNMTPISPPPYA